MGLGQSTVYYLMFNTQNFFLYKLFLAFLQKLYFLDAFIVKDYYFFHLKYKHKIDFLYNIGFSTSVCECIFIVHVTVTLKREGFRLSKVE